MTTLDRMTEAARGIARDLPAYPCVLQCVICVPGAGVQGFQAGSVQCLCAGSSFYTFTLRLSQGVLYHKGGPYAIGLELADQFEHECYIPRGRPVHLALKMAALPIGDLTIEVLVHEATSKTVSAL